MAEVVLAGKAFLYHQELHWDRARTIIAETRNAGLIARGGAIKQGHLKSPVDIRRLPMIDPPRAKKKKADLKPATDIWKVAKKAGLVKSKRKRSLQEIFSYKLD